MNLIEIEQYLITKYKYREIVQIDKGWSSDIKYYVKDQNNSEYIVRISDINLLESKKIEFNNLLKLKNLDLNISNPIEFGTIHNEYLYMILKWIPGIDLENHIENLSIEQQYQLGRDAGIILRKIHSLNYEIKDQSWYEIYLNKINRTIKNYKECEEKIEFEELLIKYIYENLELLKTRNIVFQHGDFHIGNFVLHDDKLGVIDFNRSEYGDPWEEFDRYVFTWRKSEYFATGLIDSYFDNNVPEDFFKLICLYSARNILASIYWATMFGNEEINTMKYNADLIYDSYNGFTTFIPNWYKSNIKIYKPH